ncbi:MULTISPECIES: hypothetical protein [unclassified Halorhodospira]|uniref:hypothetical protein n=1 Tax=unclassified Halorhodospira TaxID=2626748 RepID=UPI001EE827B3|nr:MULTISPECIES: hypothetical protein [unclassified Halorhodospira]MCG5542033.1 hypothetical protein [Halorhodospira sp. M39old]MCG5547080.1 hypothetical protein [Halorhodospira sp. M38]
MFARRWLLPVALLLTLPGPAPALELVPRGESEAGCYATPWTADRQRAVQLVASLRQRGYIAGSEEGVHEKQVGYRVAAPQRLRLDRARERIRTAEGAGFSAALARGADGRPTVSYGTHRKRVEADRRAADLARVGIETTVEPVYRTRTTARVVVRAPASRLSVVRFGTLWRPVHCDALQW